MVDNAVFIVKRQFSGHKRTYETWATSRSGWDISRYRDSAIPWYAPTRSLESTARKSVKMTCPKIGSSSTVKMTLNFGETWRVCGTTRRLPSVFNCVSLLILHFLARFEPTMQGQFESSHLVVSDLSRFSWKEPILHTSLATEYLRCP